MPTGVSVAVADDGRAVAAWVANAGPRRGVVVRVRTSAAGAWAPAQRVSAEVPAAGTEPVVAIGEDGRRLVAWRGPAGIRVLVRGPAAAGFTALPAPPASSGFTAAALAAPSGGVVIAWAERDPAGHWTARRGAFRAGSWDADPPLDLQAAGVVSDPSAPAEPVVSVGAWGDTVIGWPGAADSADRERVAPVRVVTRVGRAGGMPGEDRWGPVETLSAAGHQLAVAAGPAL